MSVVIYYVPFSEKDEFSRPKDRVNSRRPPASQIRWVPDLKQWSGPLPLPRSLARWRNAFPAPARLDLQCPFAEKDAVKALGGHWDPAARRWFVPPHADATKFLPWLRGHPLASRVAAAAAVVEVGESSEAEEEEGGGLRRWRRWKRKRRRRRRKKRRRRW